MKKRKNCPVFETFMLFISYIDSSKISVSTAFVPSSGYGKIVKKFVDFNKQASTYPQFSTMSWTQVQRW